MQTSSFLVAWIFKNFIYSKQIKERTEKKSFCVLKVIMEKYSSFLVSYLENILKLDVWKFKRNGARYVNVEWREKRYDFFLRCFCLKRVWWRLIQLITLSVYFELEKGHKERETSESGLVCYATSSRTRSEGRDSSTEVMIFGNVVWVDEEEDYKVM